MVNKLSNQFVYDLLEENIIKIPESYKVPHINLDDNLISKIKKETAELYDSKKPIDFSEIEKTGKIVLNVYRSEAKKLSNEEYRKRLIKEFKSNLKDEKANLEHIENKDYKKMISYGPLFFGGFIGYLTGLVYHKSMDYGVLLAGLSFATMLFAALKLPNNDYSINNKNIEELNRVKTKLENNEIELKIKHLHLA